MCSWNRLVVCVMIAAGATTAAADYNWPQWLGPERNGLTEEEGLLKEWPEGGPPRLWMSREVGLGYAGPSIVDGRLFIMGARDGTTYLMARSADSGSKLWATEMAPVYENGWGDGPRSTPTVDGDRVYAVSGRGTLICCSVESGEELWRVNMEDLGGEVPTWGYAESPLVDGDLVLCTPGGAQGAIAALDKRTGAVRWQSTEVTDAAHYSSIVKGEPGGRAQYIQLFPDRVVGVDAADGSLLWESPWTGRVAVIPTPIYHDGHVYISSGYGVGCKLVALGQSGTQADTVYENKVMKSKHDGVIRVGDYLYGYSDGAGWTCQEWATGSRVWGEKGKLGKGSIGYADGMFYCLTEKDGEVALIEASPEGYREHGRFTLSPQTQQRKPQGGIWCHPVIVDGKLYLRDQELLYCFDVEAK